MKGPIKLSHQLNFLPQNNKGKPSIQTDLLFLDHMVLDYRNKYNGIDILTRNLNYNSLGFYASSSRTKSFCEYCMLYGINIHGYTYYPQWEPLLEGEIYTLETKEDLFFLNRNLPKHDHFAFWKELGLFLYDVEGQKSYGYRIEVNTMYSKMITESWERTQTLWDVDSWARTLPKEQIEEFLVTFDKMLENL